MPASCQHAEKLDLVEKVPRGLEPRVGYQGEAGQHRAPCYQQDQFVAQELQPRLVWASTLQFPKAPATDETPKGAP